MTHTYDNFFRDVLLDAGIKPFGQGGAAHRALAVVSVVEGVNEYWNPLNITHPVGSGGDWNTAHVQMYGSYAEGVRATAIYLGGDRLRWIREGLAFSTARSLMLRQWEIYYATWGSHPDFYGITTARANYRLAQIMQGPGA